MRFHVLNGCKWSGVRQVCTGAIVRYSPLYERSRPHNGVVSLITYGADAGLKLHGEKLSVITARENC